MRTLDSLSESERNDYFGFLLLEKHCRKADPHWADIYGVDFNVIADEYKAKADAILSQE